MKTLVALNILSLLCNKFVLSRKNISPFLKLVLEIFKKKISQKKNLFAIHNQFTEEDYKRKMPGTEVEG